MVGIDGDEIELSGAGDADRPRPRPRRLVYGTPRRARAPNTVPLLPAAEGGRHAANMFTAGTIDVSVRHARRDGGTSADLAASTTARQLAVDAGHARSATSRSTRTTVTGGDRAGREPGHRAAHARRPDDRPRRHDVQGRQAHPHDRHRRDRRASPSAARRRAAPAPNARRSSRTAAPIVILTGPRHVRRGVDIAKAAGAIGNPSALLERVRRDRQVGPRRRHASRARSRTSSSSPRSGLRVAYDPNYDPAKNQGRRRRSCALQTALIEFPRFGITGVISPVTGRPATRPARPRRV